jgi:hypothetical protein
MTKAGKSQLVYLLRLAPVRVFTNRNSKLSNSELVRGDTNQGDEV